MTGPEKDYSTAGDDEMEIAGIETAGADWKAFVRKNGYFRAHHPQHGEVSGESYSALEQAARKATSTGRVKVSVPFAYMAKGVHGWYVARNEATGIHGGSGNVLMRDSAGKAAQATYGTRGYFMPPSAEDETALARLSDERDAADKALRLIVSKYEFPRGLPRTVEDEVKRVREGREK